MRSLASALTEWSKPHLNTLEDLKSVWCLMEHVLLWLQSLDCIHAALPIQVHACNQTLKVEPRWTSSGPDFLEQLASVVPGPLSYTCGVGWRPAH
jgi:hypothetical protein